MNSQLHHYKFQSHRISKLSIEEVKNDFKSKVAWYAHFFRNYLPKDLDAPILDIPCGHGNFLYFLKSKGYRNIIGMDIDVERVSVARKLDLPADVGDALIRIKDFKNLAMIVSLDFLEHIEKNQAYNFLLNCRRALRQDGLLIVRVPFLDSLLGAYDLGNDFTHKWAANSGVIVDLFYEAGFSHALVKDERPVPYKPLNYIRLGVFYVMMGLTQAYLLMTGLGKINVWSRSGCIIGFV